MRNYDHDHRIGGKAVLAPDAPVELTLADVESDATGLDEGGYLHRFVLRHGVRTWLLRYSELTAGEFAYLQSLMASDSFTFSSPGGECTACCAGLRLKLHPNGRLRDLELTVKEC